MNLSSTDCLSGFCSLPPVTLPLSSGTPSIIHERDALTAVHCGCLPIPPPPYPLISWLAGKLYFSITATNPPLSSSTSSPSSSLPIPLLAWQLDSTLQQSHLAALQWVQGNLPSSDPPSHPNTLQLMWLYIQKQRSPHLTAPVSLFPSSFHWSHCCPLIRRRCSPPFPLSHSPPSSSLFCPPFLFFLCTMRMKLQSSAFFSTST